MSWYSQSHAELGVPVTEDKGRCQDAQGLGWAEKTRQ